jgi:ferritin-like metal-binding protein YciE
MNFERLYTYRFRDIDQAARLLQQTLNEEKAADEKLTEIARQSVNSEAAVGGN